MVRRAIRQEQLADPLPDSRPAGLADERHRRAGVAQGLAEDLGLARLARAVGSFERDEPTATRSIPLCRHGPSLAGPLARRPDAVYDRPLVVRPSPLHPGRRIGGAALIGAVFALLLVPAVASAHPLGNFTINHYAGVRIEPDRIDLDVVIDEAEIPTFGERQRIDTDGSGTLSDEEIEAERQVACGRLGPSLELSVDGTPLPLAVVAAGLSFPPGAAGLATMRLVCEYVATPVVPLAPARRSATPIPRTPITSAGTRSSRPATR